MFVALAICATGCVGAGADELTVSPPPTAAQPIDAMSASADRGATTQPATTSPSTTAETTATLETATLETATLETVTTLPATPSDQRTLEKVTDLTGDLASKSVVASQTGHYIAQNMMYRHTITVFDAEKTLVATVPDTVDLAALGQAAAPGTYQGAPVEAAFDSTGRFAYVSNYRMYGEGFTTDPGDSCNNDEGDPSYVYRLDLSKLTTPTEVIDRAYLVGSVPKYVAVSPDDRLLLVSNWCTFDLTVIDLANETTVATLELGRHPRGIAVTSDSSRAYVTVMGGSDIAIVDLATFDIGWLRSVGQSPRHVVLSPDDSTLYATLNGEGRVIKVDLARGEVVDRVSTGQAPRSMAISPDGTALYVVNYESDTLSKVRTSDFEVLQTVDTAHHPIGITYDSFADEVWVSCYSGVIHVFADRPA